MRNSWVEALKLWNGANNEKYCIPKKGTPAYKEVEAIRDELKKEKPGKKTTKNKSSSFKTPADELYYLMGELEKKFSKDKINKIKITTLEEANKINDEFFDIMERIDIIKKEIKNPFEFTRNAPDEIKKNYVDTIKNFTRRLKANYRKNKKK